MRVALFLAAGVLLGPIVAHATTDLEKFEKLLGKTTIASFDDLQTAKVACVCRNTQPQLAGVLQRISFEDGLLTAFLVICNALRFNTATGRMNEALTCTDWELLTK